MQVFIKSREPAAIALRPLAERRLRFALRRMVARVPTATVQLSDLNGPRGGRDKHCQVELRTDGGGQVLGSSVASDWHAALDQALARAARGLLRLSKRARSAGRGPRASTPAPTA